MPQNIRLILFCSTQNYRTLPEGREYVSASLPAGGCPKMPSVTSRIFRSRLSNSLIPAWAREITSKSCSTVSRTRVMRDDFFDRLFAKHIRYGLFSDHFERTTVYLAFVAVLADPVPRGKPTQHSILQSSQGNALCWNVCC